MNLVELLKEEIAKLGLTNPLLIAQYVYKRTGELFQYDPLWLFASKEELSVLRKKDIDVYNIESFNLTCFSWSKIYHQLLTALNIPSDIKYIYRKENGDIPTHAYVEVYIDNKAYLADLTASYQDMFRIKYGMDTYYNLQLSKKPYSDTYTYDNDSDTVYQRNEEIDKKLMELADKAHKADREMDDLEEYTYLIYQYVSEFFNTIKVDTGYVVGVKYIQYLLKRFLGEAYLMQNIYFYDKERGIYVAVHQLLVDGAMHYFAYRLKDGDMYEFKEISKDEVDYYFMFYPYKLSHDLNVSYLSSFNNVDKKVYNQ